MAINKTKIIAAAQKMTQRGQLDKAIKEYQKILAAEPDDTKVLQRVGDLYRRMNKMQEAITTYRKTAESYAAGGFFNKAVAVYRQIIAMQEQDGGKADEEILLKLAEMHEQLGLLLEAFRVYQKLMELYEAREDTREALAVLRRMSRIEPDNLPMRLRLAEGLIREHYREEGLDEYRQMAAELHENDREDEYVRVMERLLHHTPEDVERQRELASLYLSRGEQRRALLRLQDCLKLDPHEPETLRLLSRSFLMINQPDKAITVSLQLGQILRAKEDIEGAIEVNKRVLEIDPVNPTARKELQELMTVVSSRPQAPAARQATPTPAPAPMPTPTPAPAPPPSGGGSAVTPTPQEAPASPPAEDSTLTEATVLIRYGLLDKAEPLLEEYVEKYPESPEGLSALRNVYIKRKKDDAARGIYLRELLLAVNDGNKLLVEQLIDSALNLTPEDPFFNNLIEQIDAMSPPEVAQCIADEIGGGSSASWEEESLLVDEDDIELEMEPIASALTVDEYGEEMESVVAEDTSMVVEDIKPGGFSAPVDAYETLEQAVLSDDISVEMPDGIDVSGDDLEIDIEELDVEDEELEEVEFIDDDIVIDEQDSDVPIVDLAYGDSTIRRGVDDLPISDTGSPKELDLEQELEMLGGSDDAAFEITEIDEGEVEEPFFSDEIEIDDDIGMITPEPIEASDNAVDFDDDEAAFLKELEKSATASIKTDVDIETEDDEEAAFLRELEKSATGTIEPEEDFDDEEAAFLSQVGALEEEAPAAPPAPPQAKPKAAAPPPLPTIESEAPAPPPLPKKKKAVPPPLPTALSNEELFGDMEDMQPPAEAADDPIAEMMEESEFFFEQGLYDECLEMLSEAESVSQGDSRIEELRDRVRKVLREGNALPPQVSSQGMAAQMFQDDTEDDSFNLGDELADVLDDDFGDALLGDIGKEEPEEVPAGPVSEILEELRQDVKEVAADEVETHFNLGTAYREMGMTADAIDEFKLCLYAVDKQYYAMVMIAVCHVMQEDMTLSEIIFEGALALPAPPEDDTAFIYYELGTVFEEQNNLPMALAYYRMVLDIDAKYRNTSEKLQDIVEEGVEIFSGEDPLMEALKKLIDERGNNNGGNNGGSGRVSYV